MPNNHRASVYWSLDQLIKEMLGDSKLDRAKQIRFWTKVWKTHSMRNGNKPLIMKCSLCSGRTLRKEIKCGVFKVSTRGDKDYKNDRE